MEAYFEAVLALGRRVLRLLALALDLRPTWCARAFLCYDIRRHLFLLAQDVASMAVKSSQLTRSQSQSHPYAQL